MATQKATERNKDAVLQIRVTPDVKAIAQKLAEKDGITVTALVTQLIMRADTERKRR